MLENQSTISAQSDQTASERVRSLIYAVEHGDLAEIRTRLAGTDINGYAGDKDTALTVAARRRRHDVAVFLIEQGASVSVPDLRNTPIISFAQAGWIDLVALCIDRGESVHADGPSSKSALLQATVFGHADMVDLMVSKADWDEPTKVTTLNTLLCHARSVEIADALMRAGADVNGQSQEGETPLVAAARAGAADVCKRLIDCGADVNARFRNCAPLYHAALYDKPLSMVALLDAGADQRGIDGQGSNLDAVVRTGGENVTNALAAWSARRAMGAAILAPAARNATSS